MRNCGLSPETFLFGGRDSVLITSNKTRQHDIKSVHFNISNKMPRMMLHFLQFRYEGRRALFSSSAVGRDLVVTDVLVL